MYYLFNSGFDLVLIVFALTGFVAFLRTRRLNRQVAQLNEQIGELQLRVAANADNAGATTREVGTENDQDPQQTDSTASESSDPPALNPDFVAVAERQDQPAGAIPPSRTRTLFSNFKANWMIWIGGLCVALAGIFLVKYSIDAGLLGPRARIVAGVVTGLALHGLAEWLRRRGGSHDALAALAGGASIMLYASLLAGLHLYELLSPGIAFVSLAVVSLATMLLATVHGPVLAAFGLLGAYAVPVLVSTGSNNVLAALVYSLIITVAALALIRFVYRQWLWLGTLAGAGFWWLVSLGSVQSELNGMRSVYLALTGYALVAIYYFDWTLTRRMADHSDTVAPGPWRQFITRPVNHYDRIFFALAALTLAQFITIVVEPAGSHWHFSLAAVALVQFLIARNNARFAALPWLSLLSVVAGLLIRHFEFSLSAGAWWFDAGQAAQHLRTVLPLLWLFFAGFAYWCLRQSQHAGLWSSLICLSPVLLMIPAYLLLPEVASQKLWLVALLLGLIYMAIVGWATTRQWPQSVSLSLMLSAHAAYSLAVVMLLDDATLSLALAAQIVSIAWLRARFATTRLDWAIKLLALTIVVRLSLNPFLLGYPTDQHWSLWTCGGSLALVLAAIWLIGPAERIRIWLVGTAMHLAVLLFASEIRYLMYDGHIFASKITLTEAALHTLCWGTMALVYQWRSTLSQHIGWLYRFAAIVLATMALAMYVIGSLVFLNPLFNLQPSITPPVFNILLIAYGVPVLLALAGYLLLRPRLPMSGLLVAACAFIFSVMEVRHLWTPQMHASLGIGNGELYTYSFVWMAMAALALLMAMRFGKLSWYRGGMVLLLFVTAKIFLVDMNGLEGLLRVASFLGLGLCLLGLSLLHKKIPGAVAEA